MVMNLLWIPSLNESNATTFLRDLCKFMPKGKKFFNVRSERRLKESISTVHIFADGIIKSRIIDERSEDRHNLLSLFIGIPENNHSSDFLRDIVISIIIAGRDTTSSALKWFSWLLSSKLYVEHAILNELEMIRVRNGKPPRHAIFAHGDFEGDVAIPSRTGRLEGMSKRRLVGRYGRGEGVVGYIPCLRDGADGEDMGE
ncbi:hypothetical protein DVH24_023615 [Malus domestica]|uniref:Cytochrome P450 n=1 Tax=Malus domestica TaxID=3750 RepID=A0A498I756_MALDO|nr:hypothetical protein DVH24_023615 [Malus domestica]